MSAWVWVLIVGSVAVLVDVARALRSRRKLRELHARCDIATSAGAFDAAVPALKLVVDVLPRECSGSRRVLEFDPMQGDQLALQLLRRVPSVHLRPGDSLQLSGQRNALDVFPIAFVHVRDQADLSADLVTWWERDTRLPGDGQ